MSANIGRDDKIEVSPALIQAVDEAITEWMVSHWGTIVDGGHPGMEALTHRLRSIFRNYQHPSP